MRDDKAMVPDPQPSPAGRKPMLPRLSARSRNGATVSRHGRLASRAVPAQCPSLWACRFPRVAALMVAVMLVPAIVLGCWFWGDPVCSRME